MQAYSLSKRIKKSFNEVEVELIDYTSEIMERVYKPRLSLASIKRPIGFIKKNKQYNLFKKSLTHLPLSKKSMRSDGNTAEVLKNYQDDYDVFVVGSDAVWNWIKRGFPNPYLMNFDKKVVKMSYAASAYGMDYSHIGQEEKEYFASSLKDFSFIGIRDTYTENLVKDVCPECSPEFTCDPTVFLDMDDVYKEIGMSKEEFKSYIYKKLNLKPNQKLIGVMGATKEIINKLKETYGKEYVIVTLYNPSRFAHKQLVDISPFEWAAVFGLFEVTITNYFHGTLLSLCNNTPVINFDYTEFSRSNEGKIHDVMRRMDLLECHFSHKNSDKEIIDKVIDVLKSRDKYSEKIRNNFEVLGKSSDKFFEKMGEII